MHKRNSTQFKLNSQQEKAANWINGPVLIIAGAGTGKTKVLVNRVARLVQKGINPESILLLTFTRRAARDMLDRASMILGNETEINKVSGGTFHSFANKILRKYAKKIGLSNNYTILDRTDSADVIDIIRDRIGISRKERRFPFKKTLEKIINIARNKEVDVEEIIEEEYSHFISDIDDIRKITKRYQKYKIKNSLMDYNDLLFYFKDFLEKYPVVCRNYKYIMVDEYQDTNKIQGRMTYLLGREHKNVMVVGDDTQSIYSFRGANFKNMFDFKQKFFPEAKIVKLEENYRSTQPILNLANGIIDNASEKYTKVLFTSKKKGIEPTLICALDEENQAEIVSEKILDLYEGGIPLNDIAVLFRASYQAIPLEIELNKKNIPYVKHGGFKFFETAHIKDVIAHLKIIENPKDEVSWNRILLLVDGIGEVGCMNIREKILRVNKPYSELKKVSPGNKQLKSLSNALCAIAKKNFTPSKKIERLLNYYNPVLMDKFDNFPKRKEDLNQLLYIAEDYSNLREFLTDLSLEPPSKSVADVLHTRPEDSGILCLSTVHSAKGLEWHTVFIIDMLEGRFPLSYYLDTIDSLEEERRLFYVACTRAKKNLFITYPATVKRGTFPKESSFLKEIQHLTSKISTQEVYLDI